MSNYPILSLFTDFSNNSDAVFLPADYPATEKIMSTTYDSDGIGFCPVDSTIPTIDIVCLNTEESSEPYLGYSSSIKGCALPSLAGNALNQIFLSLVPTGQTNQSLTIPAVAGLYLFFQDSSAGFSEIFSIVTGVDQLNNFCVIEYNHDANTVVYLQKCSLNNFSGNLQITVGLSFNGSQLQLKIALPGADYMSTVVDLPPNAVCDNPFIMALLPFAKIKLLGEYGGQNNLLSNPLDYNIPTASLVLNQSDAQTQGFQNDAIAIYLLAFYLANTITIPSMLEANGMNYPSAAIIVDNRQGAGQINLTYSGMEYVVLKGNVFKITIVGNYAETLNFYCRAWGTAKVYVLGSNTNALYQAF